MDFITELLCVTIIPIALSLIILVVGVIHIRRSPPRLRLQLKAKYTQLFLIMYARQPSMRPSRWLTLLPCLTLTWTPDVLTGRT